MSIFTQRPGSTWTFESTLTDADNNPITALNDAWITVYSDVDTEVLTARLADANVTLTSNVLTTTFPASSTTAVVAGTYFLSVQIEQTDGSITEFAPDRIKVQARSPLYDDY